MSWTDERVEVLKKLWLVDGLSASQIAKRMSGPSAGFSRNAVIGKLHRLGISGRADPKPPSSFNPGSRPVLERRAPPPSVWNEVRGAEAKRLWTEEGMSYAQIAATMGGGLTGSSVSNFINREGLSGKKGAPKHAPPPAAPSIAAYEREAKRVELDPTVTSLTLEAHMCKWPIGDPATEGFGFCGRRTGETYCPTHRKVASSPVPKRHDAKELARSMRRYT